MYFGARIMYFLMYFFVLLGNIVRVTRAGVGFGCNSKPRHIPLEPGPFGATKRC